MVCKNLHIFRRIICRFPTPAKKTAFAMEQLEFAYLDACAHL
ncbi:hypothetical protein GCWU000322_00971 [Eubacterium saphenum ATCC 49989]|nr:hypothetical protein GCWU000322_00971 [Eubacterium saphenum ATCC 49989]